MTICRWADDKASLWLTPAQPPALQHPRIPNIKEELNRCFMWICFISAISHKDLVSCYFINLIVFMKKVGPKETKSLTHPSLHNSKWQGWHQSSAASGCKDHTILHCYMWPSSSSPSPREAPLDLCRKSEKDNDPFLGATCPSSSPLALFSGTAWVTSHSIRKKSWLHYQENETMQVIRDPQWHWEMRRCLECRTARFACPPAESQTTPLTFVLENGKLSLWCGINTQTSKSSPVEPTRSFSHETGWKQGPVLYRKSHSVNHEIINALSQKGSGCLVAG